MRAETTCSFVCLAPQETLTSPPLKLWKVTPRKSFTMCPSSEAPSMVRCSLGVLGWYQQKPHLARQMCWEFLTGILGSRSYPNSLMFFGVGRGSTCRVFLVREKVQVFYSFSTVFQIRRIILSGKKNEVTNLLLQKINTAFAVVL